MRRRRLLATLAGGSLLLAGCSADGTTDSEGGPANGAADGATDDGNAADDRTNHDADPLHDDGTVVDFETAPLTATVVGGRLRTVDGLSVALEFVAPATADGPATLTATIRNERPYAQTVAARRLLVLDDPPVGRSDDRDSIYLAPTADHPLAEATPAYERDGDGRWRLEDVRGTWFLERITFEPEAAISGDYYLLGTHRTDEPPIEPGRYRFTGRDVEFTVAVWSTDEPGPDHNSRFTGAEPPSLPDAREVRWYHDATPATETYLEPDAESVATPARIEFTLVNHGRETLSGNPYYWRLYKLEDGAWFPVAPWEWPTPLGSLEPGAVDETVLSCYADEPVERRDERTVGHLGGGRYAYVVGYSAGEETHAALFDLEAPPLSIEPEPDARIDRDGDAAVVEMPNYWDARRPATLTVRRVDSSAADVPDERLIREQLPRRPYRGLRNALPVFEPGVETIRVKTDRGTALRPFDYEEAVTRTVAFEGDLFEATATLEES